MPLLLLHHHPPPTFSTLIELDLSSLLNRPGRGDTPSSSSLSPPRRPHEYSVSRPLTPNPTRGRLLASIDSFTRRHPGPGARASGSLRTLHFRQFLLFGLDSKSVEKRSPFPLFPYPFVSFLPFPETPCAPPGGPSRAKPNVNGVRIGDQGSRTRSCSMSQRSDIPPHQPRHRSSSSVRSNTTLPSRSLANSASSRWRPRRG